MGVFGTCTFLDAAKIGNLTQVRIKNMTDDLWAFVNMSVKVNGETKGAWVGTNKEGSVGDFKTLTITMITPESLTSRLRVKKRAVLLV